MANNKQKLELTWIGKHNPEYDISNIEPRILEERTDLSYGDSDTENMVIYGDNLLGLKALLPEHEGRIKCVFIDPPYNTGSAFAHYDDSVEHSTWLSLMKPRLELLASLLSEDGSIWITIDDSEGHYLKVLADEVFGRTNFIGTVTWQKTTSVHNNATLFSSATDLVLSYAKDITKFKMGRIQRSERNEGDYSNSDNDPRGPWASSPLHVSLTSGQRGKQFAATGKSSGLFPIISTQGVHILPPKGRCWGYSTESISQFEKEKLIWWGKEGTNQPRLKRYLKENKEGVVPTTLWLSDEVAHNQEAKAENMILLPDVAELFSTPKPERLLKRIIELSTKEGDFVLDSFAGSGTTGASAHKMFRKWILIESGNHATTHILPRMNKVITGADQGGISKSLEWKGGGGYKFYELAPSFITVDEFGSPVIDGYYNDTKLIRAMCKLTNYTFSPSPTEYWKQGKGQGNNSLYVTTQLLSIAMVQQIMQQLGPNETLLICPRKFEPGCAEVDSRIAIKKIPQSILKACQFGKKNTYSQ